MTENTRFGFTRVLYLGMGTDIIAPLLLVPNFTTIYTMNIVDPGFGKSIENIRNIIKNILIIGNDSPLILNSPHLYTSDVFFSDIYLPNAKKVHEIDGQAIILEDSFDDSCLRWSLIFKYCGHLRKLIYYFNYDFTTVWPKEITNISHVIMIGSFYWGGLNDSDPDYNRTQKLIIRKMLRINTVKPWFYALTFNHRKFPKRFILYNGYQRCGTKVSKIHFNKLMGKWYNQDYE